MLFCDLLRVTVLLVAGVATALGAVSVVVANQDADDARARASPAAGGSSPPRSGIWLGRSGAGRRGDRRGCSPGRAPRPACRPRARAGSRSCGCGRSAPSRWWSAAPAGSGPQVAAIGAGYAILIALAWRGREDAVAAIEERDGVRFYVEPSSALEPVRLIRTPGLYRDRAPLRQAAAAPARRGG